MMTDLDFYTKALRLQSWVLKQIAQIKAYNEHWDAEYCKQKVSEWLNTFADNNDVKEVFAIENLTQERAKAIGFGYWDKDEFPNLMLFPLWYCFLLPYGTKVINIWGEETIYNDKTDLDVRFGCVAFGINIEK